MLLGNPDDTQSPAPPPPPVETADAAVQGVGGGRNTLPTVAAAPKRMARSEAQERSSPEAQIQLRENFDALAIFAPSVRTDANGRRC